MKHINKTTMIVLVSLMLTASLIFTGCAAMETTIEPTLPTAAATAQPTVTQSQVASTPTQEVVQQLSYVSIDVNPSVRLVIQDGEVVGVQAFNDDGESIVLDNDVTGLTPDEALNILIGAFADGGYITEEEGASLVITACGDDEEDLIAELQDAAAQRIDGLGLACDVVVSTVTNDVVDEAKENGLTPGRYLLLNYIAEQEGITLEEAKDKYGSLKMGQMVKLVDDVDAVFGHKDGLDMQALVDSGILTAEQLEILTQAQNEFKVAMQQAQQAFKQAKEQAQQQWQTSKDEIQNAFKSDKDVEAWKAAKSELKAQLDQQKQTAVEAFKQAKVQAQEQFRAAVESLGLTDEQIAALIQWDYDFDWDFNYDWSYDSGETDDENEGENPKDSAQDNGNGNGNSIKDSANDDEDDVDDENDVDDDNSNTEKTETDNGKGNDKTNNGKNENEV